MTLMQREARRHWREEGRSAASLDEKGGPPLQAFDHDIQANEPKPNEIAMYFKDLLNI